MGLRSMNKPALLTGSMAPLPKGKEKRKRKILCRISDIFVLLRHESTAVTSRGLNSWWRGVERSIARKVGRRAAPELRGQAGRRGRRTPHGTRATDEEGSEHGTVMYIGVCGAEKFEVIGHVRTEGGHEGSLPPELTYTNVNAHRKT